MNTPCDEGFVEGTFEEQQLQIEEIMLKLLEIIENESE